MFLIGSMLLLRSSSHLNPAELDSVPSLKSVPSLVLEDLNNSRVRHRDGLDLAHVWVLPVLVGDYELSSKVAEHLTEDTRNLGVDEGTVGGTALFVQGDHVRGGEGGGDAAAAHALRGNGVNNLNGDVLVELRELILAGRSTGLPNVGLLKVEVPAEIEGGDGVGVVKSHGLDTGKDNILGNLHAQSRQTNYQDIGHHHLLLGLVAHDVKLRE